MNEVSGAANANAAAAKKQLAASFFKKGIATAIFSGILYGGYTAFMTQGMAEGIWAEWYSENTPLTVFATIYVLSAVGACANDICSAIWALIFAGVQGKLGDFGRTLKTKPGVVMMCAAVVGGPIASTAYVLGLQMAGSIMIPIAALNAAIGAIIGKFVFKQKLNGKMILGIIICFGAAVLIGSSAMGDGIDLSGGAALGILAGLVAAIGWGAEGAIGGFGCSLIDSEIGITIRQCTSGLSGLIIITPIICMLGGEGVASGFSLFAGAFSDYSIVFFAISGLFSMLSFRFWYKGNSMCGAALGMACNGMYSFWGPLACLLVCGIAFGGGDAWAIPWQGWVGALVMVAGIFVIAFGQQSQTE